MINLDELKTSVMKGEEMETVMGKVSWQEFEIFVAEIFKENGFDVFQNFRFKGNRRYEIDILSVKNNLVLATDCKQWDRGRYKKSAIKNAVEKQIERAEELKNILIGENLSIVPLVITLFDEDIIQYKDVWIIPVWKLNEFLLNNL